MKNFNKIHAYFISKITFPLSNYLYNRKNILTNYKKLIKSEYYTEESLRAIQLKRLKRTIEYSNRYVPYYQKKFKEIGLQPEDIKQLEDIKLIPPLNREELIEHRKDMVDRRFSSSIPVADCRKGEPGAPIPFALFRKHKLVRDTSSGSTGTPKIFYENGSKSALNWVYELRLKNWYGIQQGAREARIVNVSAEHMPNDKIMQLRKLLWNNMMLPGLNLKDTHYEVCLQGIIKFRPEILWGIPSALVGLAEYIQENKKELGMYRPKLIIGRAAPVYDHEEKFLKSVFKCPVGDLYSAREVGHIAAKCPEGQFHINQENLLVESEREFIGMKGNGPGDILITTLYESPMPFMRYRLGDIGEVASSTCSCGRTLQILKNLLGRTEEIFKTKDGRMISSIFWDQTFMHDALARAIKRFQILYTKERNISIKIVRNDNYSHETEIYLKKAIKKNFDPETKVELIYVSNIKPQRSGKYQIVKWEKDFS